MNARLAPLLYLLLLLGGCALGTQRFGRVIDPSRVGEIKIGESTKQDVLDLFGPPTDFSALAPTPAADGEAEGLRPEPRGDVFTYEYREEDEDFFTVILFTHFERDALADRLMVFFDEDDVVKYVAFAKQTEAMPEEDE